MARHDARRSSAVDTDGPAVDPRRLPTFVIGGARKAGTTTLWSYLDQHPHIGMAELKEPQFFTRTGMFDRGWSWYTPLFAGREDHVARGEASTSYFDAPDSPDIIADVMPDLRMIFCLRHPVRRIYSDYWYDKRSRSDLPDFDTMVATGHPELESYLRRSHYATHLERYRQKFADDQILVVLMEDLADRTQAVVEQTCRFIGVDPAALPPLSSTRRNTAAVTRWVGLHRLLADHRREWTRLFPRRTAPYAWRLKEWLLDLNTKQASYPPISPDARARLTGLFDDDITYVEQLTRRDLSAWRQ